MANDGRIAKLSIAPIWREIDERKAIEKFRSYLVTNPGSIQMVVPLAEVAQRLHQGFVAALDGGRGLRAAVKKHCGEKLLVQRCVLHKRRNVCDHFADEQQSYWDRKGHGGTDKAVQQCRVHGPMAELLYQQPRNG